MWGPSIESWKSESGVESVVEANAIGEEHGDSWPPTAPEMGVDVDDSIESACDVSDLRNVTYKLGGKAFAEAQVTCQSVSVVWV